MSNGNPSAPFGYYGGVAPGEVYIPPPSPKFIPPQKSLRFTKQELETLQALASLSSFHLYLSENADNILIRKLSSENDFVIDNLELSGNPIVYTSTLSSIEPYIMPTQTPSPTPTQTIVEGPPPTPPPTETIPFPPLTPPPTETSL